MPTRITVINHKGGVGKTTLVYHLALILQERGHSVLCVDADPQCNLTLQLVGEKMLDKLLDESEEQGGRTLWSLVRHQDARRLPVRLPREPGGGHLFLVPGDVRMFRYEEQLARAWASYSDGPTASAETLTRLGRALGALERRSRADFVLFDTAPSLGALNRNVVLESDFIVVPVGTDLFSARGLKTLGLSLVEWMREWTINTRFTPSDLLSGQGQPVLAGYVLQRVRRPSTRQDRLGVARVQMRVRTELKNVVARYNRRLARGDESELRLGTIPEFQGMPSTQPRWTPENRPVVDTSKPATRVAAETEISYRC